MRMLARPRSAASVVPNPAASPPAEAGALARTALLDAETVPAELEAAWEGLSTAEAAGRLSRLGPNLLPQAGGPGLARQLFDQMFHFFAIMLWVALGLALVGGMPQLGVAIVAVMVFNGLFSFAQE